MVIGKQQHTAESQGHKYTGGQIQVDTYQADRQDTK